MDAFELVRTVGEAVATVPAFNIPDPDPSPPPGAEGVVTLFSWLKWGGLIIAALALIIGFALMAFAGLTGRDIGNTLSKVFWPLVGAIGIGASVGLLGMVAGG